MKELNHTYYLFVKNILQCKQLKEQISNMKKAFEMIATKLAQKFQFIFKNYFLSPMKKIL